MRAFVSLSAISLIVAAVPTGAAPAPRRVASLNLCTDELVLALAAPGQIASLTHLAHEQAEATFWRRARAYPRNDGSLLSVVGARPDLVLSMGGGARDRAAIARRLNTPILELPYAASLGDVIANIARVATALGRPRAGAALIRRLAALIASRPRTVRDALWLGGGGRTVAPTGLEAQWMRLAGLHQRRVPGERVTLELLLAGPPPLLLRSDYRAGQYSNGQRWLGHPAAGRLSRARTLPTDGRAWTCMGPSLIAEIERLRRELRR